MKIYLLITTSDERYEAYSSYKLALNAAKNYMIGERPYEENPNAVICTEVCGDETIVKFSDEDETNTLLPLAYIKEVDYRVE